MSAISGANAAPLSGGKKQKMPVPLGQRNGFGKSFLQRGSRFAEFDACNVELPHGDGASACNRCGGGRKKLENKE